MKQGSSNERNVCLLLCGLSGLVLGVLVWFIAMEEGALKTILEMAMTCFKNVGVTIIVLIPLMIWAIKTWLVNRDDQLTFLYIGQQAKEFGFLGTLIGAALMMLALVRRRTPSASSTTVLPMKRSRPVQSA